MLFVLIVLCLFARGFVLGSLFVLVGFGLPCMRALFDCAQCVTQTKQQNQQTNKHDHIYFVI